MVRGRKEKYDYKMLIELMYNFGRCDLNQTEMGMLLGVKPRTITRYWTRHPEIKARFKEGKGDIIRKLKSAAFQTAVAGNPQMQKYLLNNLTQYTENAIIDQSTNVTQITYGWKEKDSNDRLQSSRVSERDTLRSESV